MEKSFLLYFLSHTPPQNITRTLLLKKQKLGHPILSCSV